MTTSTLQPNPAERLAVLIDGLCKAVAAHGARGFLTVALQLLLWSRLSRMAQRARRLAARMAASEPLSIPRPSAAPRSASSHPYIRLPRGFTWLARVVPGTAAGAASLRYLLDDPEMAELAKTPPMRRLLNPLCRMLGVAMPKPPKRPAGSPDPDTRTAAAPEPVAALPPADLSFDPPPATPKNAA